MKKPGHGMITCIVFVLVFPWFAGSDSVPETTLMALTENTPDKGRKPFKSEAQGSHYSRGPDSGSIVHKGLMQDRPPHQRQTRKPRKYYPHPSYPPYIIYPPYHEPDRPWYEEDLPTPAGRLLLSIEPRQAEVFVNGHPIKRNQDHSYEVGLLQGRYTLAVTAEGYAPHWEEVDIKGGERLRLTVRLERAEEE